MVKNISIQNFKSIVNLEMELGRLNVLIGENGCGKTNILEAIAFAGAAEANKLDFEFLGSRGIRITNPELMFSAFESGEKTKEIKFNLGFGVEKKPEIKQQIIFDRNQHKWHNLGRLDFIRSGVDALLGKEISENDDIPILGGITTLGTFKKASQTNNGNSLKEFVIRHISENFDEDLVISSFIHYAPEESSLRKFSDTNQIYPLGRRGEGVFQYLKELSQDEENKEVIQEIGDTLKLFDWFGGFNVPNDLLSGEFTLKIKDNYLHETVRHFDQRSANEGFLYLLFYTTLFVSKDTPSFFSIDNIDASFNPKMCTQIIKVLAKLAEKHDKQVILTTHNPAILDGLDLTDENQRLFTIYRNGDGHTKARRILPLKKVTGVEPVQLSEAFVRGYLGGLPKNF